MNLFGKKNYISIENRERTKRWIKERKQSPRSRMECGSSAITCKAIIYKKEVTEYKLCPNCDAHFRMNPAERIAITCDEGSFEEFDQNMHPKNPMNYPEYDQVIKKAQDKSGIKEAVVTGRCTIMGKRRSLLLWTVIL